MGRGVGVGRTKPLTPQSVILSSAQEPGGDQHREGLEAQSQRTSVDAGVKDMV